MSIDFANSTTNNRKNSVDGVNRGINQPIAGNSEHRVYIQKTMSNQLIQPGLADGTVRIVGREPVRNISLPGVSTTRVLVQPQQHHQVQQVQLQRQGIQYIATTTSSNGISGTIAGRTLPTQRVIAQPSHNIAPGPSPQGYQRTIIQTQQVRPQPHYVQAGMANSQQQIRQVRYVQPTNSNIQQQNQQHFQQQPNNRMYTPLAQGQLPMMGRNLAVPLREPSPEYVPIKQEIKEELEEEESTSNSEPLPPEDANIDIQIRNVVCNYSLPLHIDLKKLAMNTKNVTYEREKGVMMKQKRNPNCFIKIYSSGKVYIVGCRSEQDCKKAARSIARHVQRVMGKADERVCIRNYRVNNVLATCRMPFGIKIESIAAKYPAEVSYEQELSVGLVWKSITPKATLRIHTTGSITVTGARSEDDVLEVISKIYPIVLEFRCQKRSKNNVDAGKKKRRAPVPNRAPPVKRERIDYGSSGVINNKVYFSDEEDDLYGELDLDE